jgi:prepilin-type N-terminal cleavage/methylation domain-containing protein
MRRDPRHAPLRAFTLVELMLVVTIVGVLSSVAVPTFLRLQLRSRATERTVVLDCFRRAIDGKFARDGRLARVEGGSLLGAWTPPYPPMVSKRIPDFRQAGWGDLDMDVHGSTYYSYFFTVAPTGSGEQAVIYAAGDLDGDTRISLKYREYVSDGTGFHLVSTDPPDGQEDLVTM